MSDRYTIYNGEFVCHSCKIKATTLRHYPATKQLTWVCPDGHLSKVNLNTRKTKDHYERKV
jgi:lysyl-tRNA synthetase class I